MHSPMRGKENTLFTRERAGVRGIFLSLLHGRKKRDDLERLHWKGAGYKPTLPKERLTVGNPLLNPAANAMDWQYPKTESTSPSPSRHPAASGRVPSTGTSNSLPPRS